MSFVVTVNDCGLAAEKLEEKLKRDLSVFPTELVAIAKRRVRYLKAIDRQQPIPIVQAAIDPLSRKSLGGDMGFQSSKLAHSLPGLPKMGGSR
jgi:hypothetical protein